MNNTKRNKIKSFLLNSFNAVDFFTLKPSDRITFENNQNYSTKTGKSASWILIALTIWTFVNFGGDMIYRKNPQSVMSQVVTSDPQYLNLPDNGFFLAFGLQDLRKKSAHYIDDTIYTVKMIQRTKVGTNISLEEIPLQRCSIEKVPDRDDLRSYFQRNQINNLLCISNESQIEPALQSTWDGPLYRNVLINIYPCTNSSTSQTICKSSEEIQNYLNFANFAMYFTNLAVNPNEFEKPITSFGKQLYTPISATTLTYIEMLFGHLDFLSDDGFLFEDLTNRQSASYLSNRQILSFNPTMVVQIDLKLDKIKTTYTRNYQKIQNVLADVGGIIQSLIVLGNFFILPLVELKFRLTLANSLFTFKTNKTLKQKVSVKKSRIPRGDSKNWVSQANSSITSENEQIKSYFRQNNEKKIKISYFSYLCTCCRNEVTKIYNKLLNRGLHNIDQMLDISFIMNKLNEIDVLKVLLFDKTQKDLFEYIPKPEISVQDLTESSGPKKKTLHNEISDHLMRSNSLKAKLAFEAFHKISKKTIKSPLDEKLLELVPKLNKQKKKSIPTSEQNLSSFSIDKGKIQHNKNFFIQLEKRN